MIIRKEFKFEGAHIVRNCSSDRCKKSIHGHSYRVEVFLQATKLDRGGMVVDFGLLKGPVRDFVDSFDHTYVMWSQESKEFKDFIKSNSARWIELPVSPSAENFALIMCSVISRIIQNTEFKNDEDPELKVMSVRVHETMTGYAEADLRDVEKLLYIQKYSNAGVLISEDIVKEWKNPKMLEELYNEIKFQNPKVEVTHE